ncbi:hypothetical protein CKM354_001143700 [Cercospora kikuchii]|uniref:Uncharacterized protein n=1 Tax=Cercospora kikuchii TaxID=84275 RepID=A0A9P3FL15_9PEZI|nr:uncharacterized protein CKM354_001143700 [Cercospora kikuchii]GIZ48374.1 hypothetical protein CKM354_001143700 [Cercospora kikuchii]
MLLSPDNRKISYRSNGNVITLELKNSKAVEKLQQVAKRGIAQENSEQGQKKQESEGLWAGLFDTLSFWVMEGVEIAAFGPYDEPAPK